MVLAAALFAAAAQADTDTVRVEAELNAANRTINDGHVKNGLDHLVSLLKQIDPTKDKDAYWRVSTTIVEFLSQVEDHASAAKVLEVLISTKVPEGHPVYFPWMQFYIGRNLAFSGKSADAENILRALTASDARLVHSPPQRAAAFVLSQIELDRGNIQQSAVWMRRAVIGTLVDKGAGSQEIVDALTYYAFFLARTRRLADAHNLSFRLAPIYDAHFSHRGPKYIKFLSALTDLQSDLGNFVGTDYLLKPLHSIVDATDIVAPTAKATAFYQDLYQLARQPPSADGKERVKQRLDQVVSTYPDFSRQLRVSVNLAYFALISDNVELADQIISAIGPATGPDEQYESYVIALRSLIAARHNQFDHSITLSRDAMDKLISFHKGFENESASYLPAISMPERAVLSVVTGLNASHVEVYHNANTLFRLEQFVNRDKSKIGLNKKVIQEDQHSDLQREEVRSGNRLRELRDRLMYDAVDALLARVVPIRQASISKDNDYSFLTRLESVEDRIVTADEQLRQSYGTSIERGDNGPIDLAAIHRVIRPNEALVTHVMALGSLLTTCINSEGWEFRLSIPDLPELQQRTIDTKL